MVSETEAVDGVLLALGGWKSKYHHLHNTLMILSSFSITFQLFCLVYMGKMVPHHCAAPTNISQWENITDLTFPPNSTITYNQCGLDIKYNDSENRVISHKLGCVFGMEYSQRKDISIISEFDLVCDREALGDLPQTLIILGQGIGALIIPIFSDLFGRRPTHIISHTIFLIISVAIAFSPQYITFVVLRLLLGIVQQGVVLTSVTFSVEIFPCKCRQIVGLLTQLSWTVAGLALTSIGFFFRDESWRTLQLIFSSVSLYVFVQIIFLDESFRWLIANKRYKQALTNLKKAIRLNKVDEEVVMKKYRILIGSGEVTTMNEDKIEEEERLESYDVTIKSKENTVEKVTLWDILKIKKLAVIVIIFWFLWCTSSLSYFGLIFTSTSLFGNPHLNIFLSFLMELPSCIMYYIFTERWGRRITSQIFFGMVGVCLIIATILDTTTDSENTTSSVFINIFTMIGKIGATGAFAIVFFYTPEFFATNVRNVGLGSSSIAARVGGMVAPYSRMLSYHISWGPGIIFGVLSILATILLKFVPETRGRQLPQTLDDMIEQYATEPYELKISVSGTPSDKDEGYLMKESTGKASILE